MRPPTAVLALAVCLLLAGCVSPTARPTPAQTPTPEPTADDTDVVVRGGTLPVDADRTFVRTTRLVGAGAPAPTLQVSSPSQATSVPDEPGGLREVLGIGSPRPSEAIGPGGVGGATTALGTVYIVPGEEASPGAVERTLAHEYVHVVQFDRNVFEPMQAATPDTYATTTDSYLVRRSMLEGGAVYGSNAYTRTYLDGLRTESEQLADLYPRASAGTRYFWGPYRYGARYIASRIDSPDGLLSVYEDPPVTTEQVLHNETPEGEPRATLRIETVVGDPDWTHVGTDTMGELYLRVVLSKHLADERAQVAAAGWGRDRAVRFENGDADADGFAWVLRWDTTADAEQFRNGMRSYLDAEADDRGDRWTDGDRAFRLTAVTNRTVVLFAGDSAFVDRAAVSGATDEVTVRIREKADAGAVVAGDAGPPATRSLLAAAGFSPGDSPTGGDWPTPASVADRPGPPAAAP